MGHDRLDSMPNTARWRHVVALIADGADPAAVAAATTEAAVKGLRLARNDDGLAHTVWLLTRVALAARTEDFPAALRNAGLDVPDAPGVVDVVACFSEAFDGHCHRTGGRTDLGEMAQLAAVEALDAVLSARAANLFGTTAAEVHAAARGMSTQAGFATLSHEFFTRFTQRFLTYHLDRELPHHVGGNGRFADPQEHAHFLKEMGRHCREAAGVVRQFAGDWYHKNNFLGGITHEKSKGFANKSLSKLRDELVRRGGLDG